MRTRPSSLAKLTRPRISGVLPRTRLFSLLDRSLRRPITWVSGPPGSGKTTLVASYLQARKLAALWYQLDAGDADVATFFHYMGEARGGPARRTRKPLPVLTPDQWSHLALFGRRFFRELYSHLTPPCVIVLDNYQDVPLHSRLHEVISEGVDELPARMRVIVLSRDDPPPDLARQRARHLISTIGWNELRLTLRETASMARRQKRAKPSRGAIQRFHRETKGWVAGLTLMLEGAAQRDGLGGEAASEAHPDVTFDYFAKEIFERQAEETQRFLLLSSMLDEMSAAMAERLTGMADAGRILASLARRHYFTDGRMRPDPVYQYHPLFREFLLRRARDTLSPSVWARAQRRAAALLADGERYESAAALLRASEDWHGLSRIICERAQALWDQGRLLTLQEWLGSLPPETIRRHGWLQYWAGMCVMPFDPVASRARFETAYDLFRAEDDSAGTMQAIASVVATFLYASQGYAHLDRWIERIERLLKMHPTFPSGEIAARMVSTVFGALVFRQPAHREIGRWAERALELVQGSPDPNRRMLLGFMLTLHLCWMGNLGKAAVVVEALRSTARSRQCSPLALLSWRMAEAYYYFHLADTEACARTVAAAVETAETSGVHVLDGEILAQGAASALLAEDFAEASRFLDTLAGRLDGTQTLTTSRYHFLRAWEAILRENVPLAFEHLEVSLRLAIESGVPIAEAQNRVALAQVLRERAEPERAARQLLRVRDLALRTDSHMLRFMSLLVDADLALDRGEGGDGERLLREAMAIGKRLGLSNTPWWRPRMMARLCARALEAGIEVDYVRDLVRKRGLTPDPPLDQVERWPWRVRVRALGGFVLERDGEPIRFSGKARTRPLAMMKLLVALGGERISEQQLADALWPDAEGDAAHQSFTVTLHRLRRLVGHEGAVVLDGGQVSLDRRHCWVDTWTLERALAQADAAATRGESAEMRACTGKALALYRGPFLAGETSAPWALGLRERLNRRLLRAMTRLGRSWEEAREWKRAIETYERGLEVDDLSEELYQRQMLCYQRLERPAEALAVYQRCRRTLTTLLGVEPSPETEALRQALKGT